MSNKETINTTAKQGRDLSPAETKEFIASNTTMNSNHKEVATKVADNLDSDTARQEEILHEHLKCLRSEKEKTHDPEELKRIKQEISTTLESLAKLHETNRIDQMEILERQEESADKSIWANICVALLSVGCTAFLFKYGKPIPSWLSRNLPKMISKKD